MAEVVKIEKYLKELCDSLENPQHKRLINAYKGNIPKESMEQELGRILAEVVKSED